MEGGFTSVNWMTRRVLPELMSLILHVWSRETVKASGCTRDFVTCRSVTGSE